MKKRLIALILLIAMLVSVSPSVVADDTEQRPTVEEILSEYHQKAFEAEVAEQSGGASTYSRSAGNSGKTLEEETVDALNAAGYEAYNVTSDNYETLETQLQTDFADMGLDPDCSYIITISGEEDSPSNNSRVRDDLFNPALPPDAGSSNTVFDYTYNGTTYRMRYVTVTYAEKSILDRMFTFTVKRSANEEIWDSVLDAAITFAVEEIAGSVFDTQVTSVSRNLFGNNGYSILDCNKFILVGATTWTLQYIQVYDYSDAEWVASQCSEFAVTSAHPEFSIYDIESEAHIFHIGDQFSFKTYSQYYNDTTRRKNSAVYSFLYSHGICALDYTGNIIIRVTKQDTDTLYYLCENDDTNTGYFFVRTHWSEYD